MKAKSMTRGRSLLLILLAVILATAGLLAATVGAGAAGGTTYNVTITKGPAVTLVSIAGGNGIPILQDRSGTTFKMVVDSKAKTDKTGTYYPVTVLAKGWVGSKSHTALGSQHFTTQVSLKANVVGKLYTSGGDVDVSSVFNGKKTASKIGDGKVDPAGSLIIPNMTFNDVTTIDETGKTSNLQVEVMTMTTGTATLTIKGSKSKLEGKELPKDDGGKHVPTPMVGAPIDLNAGTGALVGTFAVFGGKASVGVIDVMFAGSWTLQISK